MMKNLLTIPALVAMLTAGCGGGGVKSAISGSIEGAAGKTIFLERMVNNRNVRTDSTVINSDGSFVLVPAQPLEMNFYRVLLDDKDFIVIIADSTESIEVKGKAGDLNLGAKVTGSENTTMLREFESGADAIYKKQQDAMVQMQQPGLSPEAAAQYRQQVMDARKELTEYVKHWLESNSSTPAALAAVQMLDIRAELDAYKKVVNDLSPSLGSSVHYKMLKQKVDFASNGAPAAGQDVGDPRTMPQQQVPGTTIAVGKQAPEISLPDPSGKVRKLSDLKGKTVLIDFWASWCGPCRRENPNVVKAYNAYKADGFDVLSVSLDKDAAKWKEAIEADGLLWPNHVSDLQFWNSKAAADYGVHSIPFPVLVDKDGKVIAYGPNVRGPMLEAHLKQIYGH